MRLQLIGGIWEDYKTDLGTPDGELLTSFASTENILWIHPLQCCLYRQISWIYKNSLISDFPPLLGSVTVLA